MKTYLLIFLWTVSLMSQDVKEDKLAHFGVGALVSVLSYGPIHKYTKSAPKALLYSTICAFIAGAAKEAYDSKYRKTDFDGSDLAFTTFGGFVTSSFITISIRNKEKQKQLEKIEEFKKEEQILPKDIPNDTKTTGITIVPNE